MTHQSRDGMSRDQNIFMHTSPSACVIVLQSVESVCLSVRPSIPVFVCFFDVCPILSSVFRRFIVCLSTDRLSIFTKFCMRKCGRFDTHCLWRKPEVEIGFYRYVSYEIGSYQALGTMFSTCQHNIPYTVKIRNINSVVGDHRNLE